MRTGPMGYALNTHFVLESSEHVFTLDDSIDFYWCVLLYEIFNGDETSAYFAEYSVTFFDFYVYFFWAKLVDAFWFS